MDYETERTSSFQDLVKQDATASLCWLSLPFVRAITVCGSTGAGKTSLVNDLVKQDATASLCWLSSTFVRAITVCGSTGAGKTSVVNDKVMRGLERSLLLWRTASIGGIHMKSFKSTDGKEIIRISGLYSKDDWNLDEKDEIWMEHSALNDPSNKWEFYVRYRQRGLSALAKQWRSVTEYYQDATVNINHNIIELTILSPNENHEFAVFGKPEIEDKKRMQVGLFGEKPTKGNNILIHVVLFDDTMMAFENVCEKEESKDRQLLTTLAGLFISNMDKDITIEVYGLEPGYEINGSTVKTMKSEDAWKTPENSTDYPNCFFKISCKEKTTSSFKCEIIARQETNTAEAEVVTHFDQNYEATVTENDSTEQLQKELEKLIVSGVEPHLPAEECVPTGRNGINGNVYKTADRLLTTIQHGRDCDPDSERPESARDRLSCS